MGKATQFMDEVKPGDTITVTNETTLVREMAPRVRTPPRQ